MIERHDLESQIGPRSGNRLCRRTDHLDVLQHKLAPVVGLAINGRRSSHPVAEGGLIAVFGAGDEQCVALSSTVDFFFGRLGRAARGPALRLDESGGRPISFETKAR